MSNRLIDKVEAIALTVSLIGGADYHFLFTLKEKPCTPHLGVGPVLGWGPFF
jgi:hypothetical protein